GRGVLCVRERSGREPVPCQMHLHSYALPYKQEKKCQKSVNPVRKYQWGDENKDKTMIPESENNAISQFWNREDRRLVHRESASGTSMIPIADAHTSCVRLSRWIESCAGEDCLREFIE